MDATKVKVGILVVLVVIIVYMVVRSNSSTAAPTITRPKTPSSTTPSSTTPSSTTPSSMTPSSMTPSSTTPSSTTPSSTTPSSTTPTTHLLAWNIPDGLGSETTISCPSGEIDVQLASYDPVISNDNYANITQASNKIMQGKARVTIPANTLLPGYLGIPDPAPNSAKTYNGIYNCSSTGPSMTWTIPDGLNTDTTISCPSGEINVLLASYDPNIPTAKRSNITNVSKTFLNGKTSVTIPANTLLPKYLNMPDPAPGTSKVYSGLYKCKS